MMWIAGIIKSVYELDFVIIKNHDEYDRLESAVKEMNYSIKSFALPPIMESGIIGRHLVKSLTTVDTYINRYNLVKFLEDCGLSKADFAGAFAYHISWNDLEKLHDIITKEGYAVVKIPRCS
jgi:hypothetical protein